MTFTNEDFIFPYSFLGEITHVSAGSFKNDRREARSSTSGVQNWKIRKALVRNVVLVLT